MSRVTIYTYSKEIFDEMYKDKEEQGIKAVSLSQLPNKTQLDNYVEEGFKVEIDLTSVVALIEKNEDSIYQFESYINLLLDEQVEFIIEERYVEKALNLFYFTFDKSEPMSLYTIQKDKKLDEAVSELPSVKKITDLTDDEIINLYEHLNKSIIGHKHFKSMFIKKVESFKIFNTIGEHKILSAFLLGPSGVGKTEFAKEVHRFFRGDTPLVKINFGNYSSQDSLNNLIGSPRGYIGSEDGELSKKIMKSRTGVILIDEFEKADKKVFNFFLELLEEGTFTNSLGEVFDLEGYVIFFTSNLNQRAFSEKLPPELRSRFDIKSEFLPLSLEDKEVYLSLKISQLVSKLAIENKEWIKQEMEQAKEDILHKQNNLREINKLLRDQLTKLMRKK